MTATPLPALEIPPLEAALRSCGFDALDDSSTADEVATRLDAFAAAVAGVEDATLLDVAVDVWRTKGVQPWTVRRVLERWRNGDGRTRVLCATPTVWRLEDFLRRPDLEGDEAEWLWPGVVGRGVLSALIGRYKCGKSTLGLHLAAHIAEGEPFLGIPTAQAPVLWVNLEVSERQLRYKLHAIAGEVPGFHVVSGTKSELGPAFLATQVRECGIGLVVLDSLAKWWSIAEENSATETDQGIDPALQLARTSGAAVLALVHTTKHGRPGEDPLDAIRGSGAIAANLDLGVLLSSVPNAPTMRKLQGQGRFDATLETLYADLRGGTYHAVADAAEYERSEQRAAVLQALADEPLTVKQLLDVARANGLDVAAGVVRERLKELVASGEAVQAKDGKAFVFTRVH